MPKLKKIQEPSKLGGHIKTRHIELSAPKKLKDVIYNLTHKKYIEKKAVAIFMAKGIAVDEKLEQVNKLT